MFVFGFQHTDFTEMGDSKFNMLKNVKKVKYKSQTFKLLNQRTNKV